MSLPKTITLLELTGTAVDANGTWVYVGNLQAPYAVHVVGAGVGDEVKVCVSNRPTKPGPTDHDVELASVTTPGMTTVAGTVAWLKARKPAATQSSAAYVAGIVP